MGSTGFGGPRLAADAAPALRRDAGQLSILILASKQQWNTSSPPSFGTLLERALDPEERHQLCAHYTPRAYVEPLVLLINAAAAA